MNIKKHRKIKTGMTIYRKNLSWLGWINRFFLSRRAFRLKNFID